jgi:hypothetical protein
MTPLTAFETHIEAPGPQCPGCGAAIANVPDRHRTTAIDISICAFCRLILIITSDRRFRILSNKEWAALSPEVRTFVTRVREGLAPPSSSKVSA